MNTIESFADHLGVSADVLRLLDVQRKGSAWYIPERDADGQIVGKHIRHDAGKKMHLKGTHRGLTLAWPLGDYEGASLDQPILIVEGMSDVAAGMTLGFPAVGRPSATGGGDMLTTLLKNRHVVIIGENDDSVGHSAAWGIAKQLLSLCASVRVIFPPEGTKDLRVWSQSATKNDILRAIKETHVMQPGADSNNKSQSIRRTLQMRVGSTIDDAGTEYLWQRRLAMSSINVIFSRPGRGKSTLATDLTGHVTSGRDWPDGTKCEKGFVLYLKGEGTDRSVNDRMRLAGADPTMYGIISKATGAGQEMIDLATDSGCVSDLIDQNPDTRLVIVDTLDSMFPSMRMINNSHIRQCLWPVQSLVEKRGVCVVILAHTNKGGYADPIDRLSGGRAIGGAARSIWYLGKLDHEEPECYMASVKVNDFLPAPTLEYQIVGLGPDQPGSIRWGEERDDVTDWALDRPSNPGHSSKSDSCEAWLAELLANGPVQAGIAVIKAKEMGFGGRVMPKAKATLGIKSKPAKGVTPPEYYMCLPEHDPPDLRSVTESKPRNSHTAP